MIGPSPPPARTCHALWMGTLEYPGALQLQLRICDLKKRSLASDVLLLLEHSPTITLGRNGNWNNLLASGHILAERGIQCHEADRGGDITFHGPGQLVGYPLLRLEGNEKDVHQYMRNLEEVLIRVLSVFGIESWRRTNLTGVWTTQGKIASLGVHISRWITRHGFALNVETDLSFFDLILPCGLTGTHVTSMHSILGRQVSIHEVADCLASEFGAVLGRKMVRLDKSDLMNLLENDGRETAVA